MYKLDFLLWSFEFEELFRIFLVIAIFSLALNIIFVVVNFILLFFKKIQRKKSRIRIKGVKSFEVKTKNKAPKAFSMDSKKSRNQKKVMENKFELFKFKKFNIKQVFLSKYFWFFVFNIVSISSIYMLVDKLFYTSPNIISLYPQRDAVWNKPEEPIVIKFNVPINQDKIKIDFVPDIGGKLEFVPAVNNFNLTREIKFYPKENQPPGSYINIFLDKIESTFGKPTHGREIIFRTYEPPVISSLSIKDGDEVKINDSFQVNIDREIDKYSEFDFTFEPKLEFEKELKDKTYTLKPKSSLPQATDYKLSIFRVDKIYDVEKKELIRNNERIFLKEVKFSTLKAPEIDSFTPQGSSLLIDSEISIKFNKPMIPESVASNLQISPSFEYSLDWNSDNTEVKIIPNNGKLDFDTSYEIKLLAGTKGINETLIENEFVYSFSTIGEIEVIETNPYSGAGNIGLRSPIRVVFNQPANRSTFGSKFSISPNIEGGITWESDSVLVFTPNSDYAYNKAYTFTISAGVEATLGKTSTKKYSYTFYTQYKTVSLNVPLYRQPERFLCNITATSMVLNYKGVSKGVYDVFSEIPKDPTKRDKEKNIWGDPDAGYVGDASGPDGYGVHWGPVSQVLSNNGVNNSVKSGMSLSQLASEIEAGNPVIIWWWNGVNSPDWETWKTPSGKEVRGLSGMHSEVVVGYNGSVENPISFIVNDPRGSKKTVNSSNFQYLWSFFGNTGVVVY